MNIHRAGGHIHLVGNSMKDISLVIQRTKDISRKIGKYRWISTLVRKIFPTEDAEFPSLIEISFSIMNQD